jgi:hypothetical protein
MNAAVILRGVAFVVGAWLLLAAVGHRPELWSAEWWMTLVSIGLIQVGLRVSEIEESRE